MMIDISELERMAERRPHMRLRNAVHLLRKPSVAEDLKRAVRPAVGEREAVKQPSWFERLMGRS